MGSIIFLIAFFFVSFSIVGLVLLQEGKGGGLTGMSSGMDGVMGARNPLRRMTAYLFVVFVIMAIGINVYFHNRVDDDLPVGVALPDPVRTLQEEAPAPGAQVLPEGSLRPESEPDDGAPLRPDESPAAPIMSIRPEADENAPATPAAPEETAAPEPETAPGEAGEATANLRPEPPTETTPSLQPPADAESVGPVIPPAPEAVPEPPVEATPGTQAPAESEGADFATPPAPGPETAPRQPTETEGEAKE